MGAAFIVTLREGVEIALIIAILLAYLSQVGRRDRFGAVWAGIAGSTALCVALAVAFEQLFGGFTGKAEQLTEAIVSGLAAVMLTVMIFWMRRHARGLKGDLQTKLGLAVERSALAVAIFAAISVLREGIETALLLLGASEGQHASSTSFVVGGLAGLVVASWIGYAFYSGSRRIDLRRFFSVTATLLILFAAGMVGKSVHELREYFVITGTLADPVWQVTNAAFSTSWFAQLLAGTFGWSPRPELVRVLAYLLYAIPVLVLYHAPTVRLPRFGSSAAPRSAASA
jgi:high-affinity iron transporter